VSHSIEEVLRRLTILEMKEDAQGEAVKAKVSAELVTIT
jgi:hypothetical protein